MLGMGKPFGMGVVHLETHLILRKPVTRYSALFDGDGWATGESEAYDAALPDVIGTFTEHMKTCLDNQTFESQERIKSLKLMLQARDLLPDFDEFTYMSLVEFKGRPLLSEPAVVDQLYKNKRREIEQQRRASRPVEVGKRVSGNLKDSDEDYLWFEITSGRTENPHLAAVPPDNIAINKGMVNNVIVEAIENDGGTTYYWCRRENESEREERKKLQKGKQD